MQEKKHCNNKSGCESKLGFSGNHRPDWAAESRNAMLCGILSGQSNANVPNVGMTGIQVDAGKEWALTVRAAAAMACSD
jgi:hypothetical protein